MQDIEIYDDRFSSIIATTDSILKLYESEILAKASGFSLTTNDIKLPSIPQSFIEYYVKEYNKGNVVKEVGVEYSGCDCEGKYVPDHRIQDGCGLKLKLNLDNTINIKPIKDSWTREEILKIVNKALWTNPPYNESEAKEWINKNL
jgi:hypothetical protein